MSMLARVYAGSFLAIASRYLLVAVAPLVFIKGGASDVQVGILVGLAFLVQMLASPFLGKFADTRGRKTSLLLGSAMMLLGGLTIFAVPSMPGFIIGQLLFGIGPAAFFAAAFAMVADAAPAERRASAMARFGILINASEALAPPIGLMLSASGAPDAFLWSAVLAALAILAFLLLPQSPPVSSSAQPQSKQNLVPRSWWTPLFITAFLAISYGAINAFLPQRASNLLSNAGWFFTANFGVQIVLRIVAARTLDRFPRQVLLAVGAGAMAVATILLAYATNNVSLFVLGMVYGAGSFYSMPALVAWLIDRSETRKGSSMAAYNAAFGAGVALGSMSLGMILPLLPNSVLLFWIAGLFSAFGIMALFFPSRTSRVEARGN